MADEEEFTAEQKAKIEKIESWIKQMLLRSGVRVINFARGDDPPSYGLLNVPGKYCRIIDTMHIAMVNLALGHDLPEFLPLPRISKKVRSNKIQKLK